MISDVSLPYFGPHVVAKSVECAHSRANKYAHTFAWPAAAAIAHTNDKLRTAQAKKQKTLAIPQRHGWI